MAAVDRQLAEVHELGGVHADNRHSEQHAGVAIEDSFEHAGVIAEHATTRVVAVVRAADDDVPAAADRLFLGEPNGADCGDGVDPDGDGVGDFGEERNVKHVAGGDAALFHAGRRERGEADDITGGEDAAAAGAVARVDLDVGAFVGLDADVFQPNVSGIAVATERPQHAVALDGRSIGHGRASASVCEALDLGNALAETQLDADLVHAVQKNRANFLVEKSQQCVARFDERDINSELAEDARVLAADHARADDDQRMGHGVELEDSVGVDDGGMAEIDMFPPGRRRSRCDEDVFGGEQQRRAIVVGHANGVSVDDLAAAVDDLNARAFEAILNMVGLLKLRQRSPRHESLHGEAFGNAAFTAGDWPATKGARDQSRFAQHLRGDGAGVDHCAAGPRRHFDDRAPATILRGNNRRSFACGARSDGNEVIGPHGFGIDKPTDRLQQGSDLRHSRAVMGRRPRENGVSQACRIIANSVGFTDKRPSGS